MPSVIKGEKYKCLNDITVCNGFLAMYAQVNNIKLKPSFYKDKIYECNSSNALINEYGEKIYFKLKDVNKYFKQIKNKMREIKFRGQYKSSVKDEKGNKLMTLNRWVYGFLVSTGDKSYIFEPNLKESYFYNHLILPETIGQFTGLKDKNGKEIYEGDIISYTFVDCDGCKKDRKDVIEYINDLALYVVKNINDPNDFFDLSCVINRNYKAEVIGNIYDHKNLLEDAE